MPLKKSAGKKAENKERTTRARARAAAIKKFGKAAVKGKDVHHKNGNNKDNRPSNLGIKAHGSHGKSHGRTHGKRGTRSLKH
jgi:hypothetical protein